MFNLTDYANVKRLLGELETLKDQHELETLHSLCDKYAEPIAIGPLRCDGPKRHAAQHRGPQKLRLRCEEGCGPGHRSIP